MSNLEWDSTGSPIDASWVASGLRRRILLPLAGTLVVLLVCLAAMILVSRAQAVEEEVERKATSFSEILEDRTRHEVGAVQAVMERVMADTRLQDAFRRRDAQALLALSRPIHEINEKRNGISHFYYILPDSTALLRVHAPEHGGDRIDRESLREAQRTGAPAWLNEQGMTGSFTLRVVYPWRVDGELLGYLEMGIEYDHVAAEIKQALDVNLLVAVNKSRIDRAHWASAQKRAGRPDHWDEFPHLVVVARTRQELPEPVRAYLAAQEAGGEDHKNFEVRTGDAVQQVIARPFVIRGERVGRVLVLQDITGTIGERRAAVLQVAALFAAIGGALIALLHVLLGRVQQDVRQRTHRLEEAQRRLVLEQHEHARSQLALERQQERNEMLEARARLAEELGAAKDEAQAALRENEAVTAQLRETQAQLLKAAREAGRAEVATNVLHNVGNVLSSVNVSAGVIGSTLRNSRLPGMTRALQMMDSRAGDLGEFITRDEKGKLLPGYLKAVNEALAGEHGSIAAELDRLTKSVDHIKDIVATQQSHASAAHVIEPVAPSELADEALRMQGSALARHQVTVVREYDDIAPLPMDRGRILQILINLISNAKAAMSHLTEGTPRLTVRVQLAGDGSELRFCVMDEGEGIPPENLTRIFSHGFTTRRTGHGFGLHSSAVAAGELGGTLTAHSDGVNRGATFVLALPVKADAAATPAEVAASA